MKRIIIIGTGFAGLTAVRQLRKLDSNVNITVINKTAEFLYYPSLIWIPSGLRKGDDLIVPLDNFFKRMKVTFHAGLVTGLKANGRVVITEKGELENDGLIIASGGRFIKKLPGIEHVITPCEGIVAVETFKQKLQQLEGGTIAIGFGGNPKEPSAMRGGPMFEFLFGLHTQLVKEKRRDKFKLIFFNPAKEPGKRLGPKAVGNLLKAMEKRQIETHLGHKIKGFEANKVITEGGEFNADLILFMPGMTGNLWFDQTELPRSEGGLVKANQYCQVEGMDKVYVAGDSGSFPGPGWMPKQAHMADLQAKVAAENLLAEFSGAKAQKTFTAELVCIVDSQNAGMLVTRTPNRSIVLPTMRLFHWSKRWFEWWYLRQYR